MDMAYFIINNIKYIFDYNKYKFEIYKLVNSEKYSLTDEERKYFNDILKEGNNYIFNTEVLDDVVASNNSITSSSEILELIKLLEKVIPEKYRTNLYNNLKTLIVLEVEQEELDGKNVPANYDALTNTIKINYSHESIKDNEKKKRAVIFHELVHMASSHYDKENNIVYSGFHKIDLNNETNNFGLGLTEGFTEYLATSTIYNEPGVIQGIYIVEQMLVNQLSCIVGDEVLFDAFFNNKGISYLKENLSHIFDDRGKLLNTFLNIESYHYLDSKCTSTDSVTIAQFELISFFEEKCKRALADAYTHPEVNNKMHELLNKYNMFVVDTQFLTSAGLNSNKYEYIDESAKMFDSIKGRFEMILPSFNGIEGDSIKKMGYIKIGVLAIVSILLCLSILIFGIIFK